MHSFFQSVILASIGIAALATTASAEHDYRDLKNRSSITIEYVQVAFRDSAGEEPWNADEDIWSEDLLGDGILEPFESVEIPLASLEPGQDCGPMTMRLTTNEGLMLYLDYDTCDESDIEFIQDE